MTEAERLATEARALSDNDVFSKVLAQLQDEAKTALVTASADDTATIRDHQAMARAIDAIRNRVNIIAASGAKPKSGLPQS